MGLYGPKRFPAGYALNFSNTNYYVLKLWFQPDRTYYICPNGKGDESYTIYGRKSDDQKMRTTFQNPIGFAHETQDKVHLEVVLPDLAKRYYMSLSPTE